MQVFMLMRNFGVRNLGNSKASSASNYLFRKIARIGLPVAKIGGKETRNEAGETIPGGFCLGCGRLVTQVCGHIKMLTG